MIRTTITSLVAGISILAASLAPVQVSALSDASLSLAGSTNTTGAFSTIIYGNTGADDANTASVSVSFSGGTVSGVSYDYSVGQFRTQTPSGAYGAAGKGPSGTFPIAAVRFTVASPAVVTATASGTLKHAVRDANGVATGATENFAVSAGTATFTFNAPEQGGMGGGSHDNTTTTTTSGGGNTVAQNTGNTNTTTAAPAPTAAPQNDAQTKGAATEQKSDNDNKKEIVENTGSKKNVWPWIILLLIAGTIIAYVLRNRAADTKKTAGVRTTKPAEAPRAVEAAAAAAGTKKAASAKADKPNGRKRSGRKNR